MTEEERAERQDEMKSLSFVDSGKPVPSAPEGYFNELPDHIIDRWRKEQASPGIAVMAIWKRITTAAIVTAICLGITWWASQAYKVQESNTISSGEAYEYILEHIDEFAPLILQTEQLAEEKTTTPETSAIEEYLLEELDGEDFENIF